MNAGALVPLPAPYATDIDVDEIRLLNGIGIAGLITEFRTTSCLEGPSFREGAKMRAISQRQKPDIDILRDADSGTASITMVTL